MPYRSRIRDAKPGLSKNFNRLADYILDYYPEVAFLTATNLAQIIGVDTATVIRFAQHIGYEGYPELLHDIREHVLGEIAVRNRIDKSPDSKSEIGVTAIENIESALEQTKISLDMTAISKLVDAILAADRIILLAEGPAQPSAFNMLHYLEQGNFTVTHARSGLSGTARIIHSAAEKDLIIAYNIAEEAPYFASALREIRSKGTATAVIAGSPSLASTRSAEIIITARANPNLGISTILLEALTYTIVKELQQRSPERFQGSGEAIAKLTNLLQ
jgi:DNA-binding MurR/RpiR family transcriptional regulator